MAGLPPGDPQLVSMIVNHLKTQGLFDQFRRDCLADVDTKPAYLNLKQRVDNFVSNHLSNHTWSPHLNKNQLRNNIRQLVLQSGMLEQGVDRIVAQVVDPKINHTFRPQVERVVREFLSPGSYSDEPPLPVSYTDVKPESSALEQVPSVAPPTTTASDAMSILDTITSLNQGASSWAGPSGEKGRKGLTSEEPMQGEKGDHDMVIAEGGDHSQDGQTADVAEEAKLALEIQAVDIKTEESQVESSKEEGEAGEVKTNEEETDAEEGAKEGGQEQADEEKDKAGGRTGKSSAEKQEDDDLLKSPSQIRQKARERLKEEYSLEDSDLEGLSDITVSSVHTSDLSSFEEDSDEEQPLSSSSSEGQLPSDGEGGVDKEASADKEEDDKEQKPRRKAYVHKPFLYSRYYSDSDDEVTVEERRRCAAKDKEDRLLKRQQNRERMEERRKQKAAQAELQARRRQQRSDSPSAEQPQAKQARKERKVLEKKMALNRKRKLDSRKEGDTSSRKKSDSVGEGSKRELKSGVLKPLQPKSIRKESQPLDERNRRHSGSVSEDSSEPKKSSEKSRTHSFILELEQGSQDALKHRPAGKFDRHSRKDSVSKERKEKDRSVSDERAKPKQKPEKSRAEAQTGEASHKEAPAAKTTVPEEKGEKKAKVKGEKKTPAAAREGRWSVLEGATDEGTSKDPTSSKKGKAASMDSPRPEKEKEGEKEKGREKVREKEKPKGEKNSTKSESPKVSLTPDTSSASRADRGEVEVDGAKRKEKPPKELLRRSKSCSGDRPGDKPKGKTEGRDGEREKAAKVDAEGPKASNKSSSEADKDPRRSKVTEKGKVPEKASKSKVREDVKSPSSSSSKSEKKAPAAEVKGKAVPPVGKHDAVAKEKGKDGSAKENRHAPEEPLQEKPEETRRAAKRKAEKGDKIPERKDNDGPEAKKKTTKGHQGDDKGHQGDDKGHQGDDKGHQGDDKLEKAAASSLPSPVVEADETPAKKSALLQDASIALDPAVATVTPSTTTPSTPAPTTTTASPSDDTYDDALSDITPEPGEGETEARLRDLEGLPRAASSVAADPLLTLVDICTSADALVTRDPPQAPVVADAEDAEIKMMTEAALTLLSMDPESIMSACVPPAPPPPPADTTEGLVPQGEAPAAGDAGNAGDAGDAGEGVAADAPPVAGVEPATESPEELSPVSPDRVPEPEDGKDQNASDSSEKEPMVSREQTAPSPVPEVDQIKSDKTSILRDSEMEAEPETPSDDPVSPEMGINTSAAGEAGSEHLKTKVNAETTANTQVISSDPPPTNATEESESSSQPGEPKPEVEGAEMSAQEEEMEVGEIQATVDVDNVAVQAVPEGEGVTKESQNTVCDVPAPTLEVEGTKHPHESKTAEDTVSDLDKQEEEKTADLSQKEDKTEGRVTRKRRLSMQKSSCSKDSAEKEEKDGQEQPSVEETEEVKAPETRAPRRGRSSRAGPEVEEEEEEPREEPPPKEVEKKAETPTRRGRRPANQAQDTTTSTTTTPTTIVQENDDKKDEEKEKTPLDQKESEAHGVLDAVDTSDPGLTSQTVEPSKTEGCEEPQISAEETSEEQEEKRHSPVPGDQSEDLEEGKQEGSSDNKTDVEEDQPRTEQETTPKKPARRGRPPKAAAAATAAAATAATATTAGNADSADKMEEKADESGLNTEEDEDEEEGDHKSRTTRSASRMEAEKNKPSKPSTRASRHSGGKEEAPSGTPRGTRGQAAGAKGARKREASPPAVRTRGGAPKPEETPSKRSKR